MSSQLIQALDSSPNQQWPVSVQVDGAARTFFVLLKFNETAGYWVAALYGSDSVLLLDSIPLVTGLNLLRQYDYLAIGSLFLVNISGSTQDSPGANNLGTDFQLVWGDTA